MKPHLQELIAQALLDLIREGVLPKTLEPDVAIERTRSAEHGHYASNIAMTLAKSARMPPRELAAAIIDRLLQSRHVEKVDIAGPGFINFHLTESSVRAIAGQVLKRGDRYGRSKVGAGQRVTVEFVSANPTGPLHVGHGRGAAYGASLAAVLDSCGYDVQREYYVNDHGRQMDILAVSVWLRYMELGGTQLPFPAQAYQGDYIYDIARTVRSDHGDDLRLSQFEVLDGLPEDGGDEDTAEAKLLREKHIDALISRCKELLGAGYGICFEAALDSMVADIRDDLASFNVNYDHWFSERNLASEGAVDEAISELAKAGHIYDRDGAKWFRASALGDEKDRVVERENGLRTYFASDIAYLRSKLTRFDHAIYILGADHHGYIARIKAAARGLGFDPERIEIVLVQFAHLYRGKVKMQMSTRSGKFVTLRELREEVGNDAARFFYVMRSHDQHLDFDLELAKSQTADNPVYYIQYAHARICRIFARMEEQALTYHREIGAAAVSALNDEKEFALLAEMAQFPDVLAAAARNRGPHLLAHYLRDLAQLYQSFYESCPILKKEVADEVRAARLYLSEAVRQVIANGLAVLGVSAPEQL